MPLPPFDDGTLAITSTGIVQANGIISFLRLSANYLRRCTGALKTVCLVSNLLTILSCY